MLASRRHGRQERRRQHTSSFRPGAAAQSAVVAAVLTFVLTGATECGGNLGKGGVKQSPTVVARLSCKGDRILATANGSGWARNKRITVDFELRGPQDDNSTTRVYTGSRGSWSARSDHWTPAGDGTYTVRVDAHGSGESASDSKDCTRG